MITLDGSPLAEQALGPGFALAAAFGEKVILLRVIDEHLPASRHDLEHLERQERGLGRAQPDGSDLREITEAYLQRIARLQAQPGLEIQIDVTVGAAAESIIARIGALAVDAVVMATHGRTGLRRWVYGSVTEKVLDSAHCSLLVIRPDKAHLF
jgi:nucleotide-binding universal stress UspA family protein